MGWGRARGEASLRHCGRNLYVSGWGAGRREASLPHCGRNLYVSGWGAGGLGGKPAYGTAVGILTSVDVVREG